MLARGMEPIPTPDDDPDSSNHDDSRTDQQHEQSGTI